VTKIDAAPVTLGIYRCRLGRLFGPKGHDDATIFRTTSQGANLPTTLNDRRQALENCFIRQKEASHSSRKREEQAAKKNQGELRARSGIDDADLLATLAKLRVGGQDMAALALVPLIYVAWIDGTVSEGERSAVLQSAAAQGIESDSHGYELLRGWLTTKPDAALFDAWTHYVLALREALKEDDMATLRDGILGLAHDVASAAGGILGIGAISSSEKAALKTLSDAFDGQP